MLRLIEADGGGRGGGGGRVNVDRRRRGVNVVAMYGGEGPEGMAALRPAGRPVIFGATTTPHSVERLASRPRKAPVWLEGAWSGGGPPMPMLVPSLICRGFSCLCLARFSKPRLARIHASAILSSKSTICATFSRYNLFDLVLNVERGRGVALLVKMARCDDGICGCGSVLLPSKATWFSTAFELRRTCKRRSLAKMSSFSRDATSAFALRFNCSCFASSSFSDATSLSTKASSASS